MTITLPAAGSYTLRNASVPASVMDDAASGALRTVDIAVTGGAVSAITPASSSPTAGGIDLDGGIVLPAFVDLHTHLDKGHIWPRRQNPDGTWIGALMAVLEDRQANWAASDVERRMDFALRCAYAHGTAAIRTHLDMAPPQHTISWDVFEAIRARWAGRIELQGVGLMGPDTILDPAALRAIAERTKAAGGVLGGSTAVHAENPTIMRRLLEMAGEFDLDIDLHTDESPDPAASALRSLADAVIETGFTGTVVAGHCCALANQPADQAQATIERVAQSGVAVVSLPMCNMYLQDRDNVDRVRTPRWRGVTLLNELKTAGVPVAIASDNTRDPFYAYGDLDGFEVLREGARILQFDHPQADAFAWARSVGADPAAIAGFAHAAKLAVGVSADLVLFGARNWTELMSRPQSDRTVLRAGAAIDTTLPDYRELDDLMGPHL
ncbi:cytosine deaminase [Devosia neptuniae]|uniref:cytosine deaminase n=1 Tax=Devosia neptuniae TaxID=191302 RepID=UPI0022AE66DD|nr:cytosine deaminase [Devosia neptuniae]MCZ4346456.1 cytosine deaminase [Devosia neptuniae]|tara:strand:- start:50288 stop:51604 length:1317 start_codon:yes stop_codon:yes gene_type:complete